MTETDLKAIDEVLISNAHHPWRKVAMVVGLTMDQLQNRFTEIPDLFYAERLRKLVQDGRLESQGNLAYVRLSEVRLPQTRDVFKTQ